MLKIAIPKPCHEDWTTMTPNQQGRHCSVCSKTVVDFTGMTDEAVLHYFLQNKEGSTCGRFRNEQVQRASIELPGNIFHSKIAGWKKFLAACLLIFSTTLFSCDTSISQGKVMGEPLPEIQKADSSLRVIAGGFNPGWDSSIQVTTVVCNSTTVGLTSAVFTTDSAVAKIDTVPSGILIGDTILMEVPDSLTTKDSIQQKNPPAADSNNCNTIKYY